MKVSMLFVSGFIVIVLVFGMTILSHAELVDNNDGTITDTDTGLMWLQDANYAKTSGYDDDGLMNWFEAKIWADNLVYAGYDDWRLPSALNTDGTGPCQLDNCTDSEIGHLYYTELGNVANGPLKNSLNSSGDFQNLQSGIYWSGTEYAPMPDYAWHFHFSNGFQSIPNKSMNLYALAVRTTGVLLASISDIPFVSDGAEEKKEIQRVKQQDEIIMDNQYSSQTIYTIQTGSFLKVTQAQKMFDSMPQILNEQEFSFLRIEKIGTYYSVRLGRYDNYNDTEKFLQEITPRLSEAIILNAYIKNERIIKLYE